jgi:hypothetical protein
MVGSQMNVTSGVLSAMDFILVGSGDVVVDVSA